MHCFFADLKVFIQLCLMSYMDVSNARIRLGEKRFWKPSRIESIEGIVTHVKVFFITISLNIITKAYVGFFFTR